MKLVKHLLLLVLSYNSKKLNCPSDMKGMRVIRIPFSCCFGGQADIRNPLRYRALSFSATFSYAGTGT